MAQSIRRSFLHGVQRFDRDASISYQLFMLVLCIYAIGALAIETLVSIDQEISIILQYTDLAVCAVFFLDFLFCFYRAKGARWSYLVTWGWLDLLSSVPALDVARWGRLARLFRIFRVLRGLRMSQIAAGLVLKHRAQSTILASALAALILIVTCSVAILRFEDDPDSNIRSGGDAIWWAFATITTVGYGDRFPVTAEGRVIASILMTAGVGLSSTLAAFMAAWFLAPSRKAAAVEESSVEKQLNLLRESIDRLTPLTGYPVRRSEGPNGQE